MENLTANVFTSSVRSTTTTSSEIVNYSYRGLHLVINVTSVPGTDTITPKIQGVANDISYDILIGSPISTTGLTIIKIYPGISAIANVSANDILPNKWKVIMTHSAGTNFTYTVTANMVN